MRMLAFVFAVVLLGFAALQLNDPDPVLWVALYLYPAALCVWAARGAPPRWLLLATAGTYLLLAIYWWPGGMRQWLAAEQQAQSLEMQLPFIEEAREALGLLICAVLLAVLGWRTIRT